MVHYKDDRPNGDPWGKDTNIELHKNLKSFFNNSKIKADTITQKDVAATQEIRKEKSEGQPSDTTYDFVITHNNTWIFQGNPNVFDIDNYVTNHRYIWWSLRQEHFSDTIQINDEVFLWRSDGGKRGTGGIIAKAKILGLHNNRTDDENAKDYWHTDDWENPYLAVKLEVLEVRLKAGFISRLSLLEHPVLKDLFILRLRQQTNYLIPPEHANELQKLWTSSNRNMEDVLDSNDLENLIDDEITETEKERIIKSRIGQSAFKKALLAVEKKCRLCGVSDERFLVASHIKPWSQSNHKERLDVNNGLLLCPNHDALFDKGYISFDVDGMILISASLDESTKVFLNINDRLKLQMNELQQKYMKWHRENIFKF
ncbi:HNH endonuclease [Peribacillus frigoritolerans]|nr:HNH endonuclease [Peribacillus frigoritolerans]MDG4850855.1 HNH endonuclease [Peribacillus frigoritolerans]